jgi:pyruvate/2-oxoglutarate dehydrogenase complex dihydrolipoamide dehydrogenase (E3) component
VTGDSARFVGSQSGPWDLLVVGGGTAGIVGAKTAARLGARVLLVERERTGGDCLWTGCLPSRALLAAAAPTRSDRGVLRQRERPSRTP